MFQNLLIFRRPVPVFKILPALKPDKNGTGVRPFTLQDFRTTIHCRVRTSKSGKHFPGLLEVLLVLVRIVYPDIGDKITAHSYNSLI